MWSCQSRFQRARSPMFKINLLSQHGLVFGSFWFRRKGRKKNTNSLKGFLISCWLFLFCFKRWEKKGRKGSSAGDKRFDEGSQRTAQGHRKRYNKKMINFIPKRAALEGLLEAAWQLSHFSQSGFDVWATVTSPTSPSLNALNISWNPPLDIRTSAS